MATNNLSPSSEAAQDQTSLDLNFELRRVLNNAYGFVQGQQATQSFSALTYEELANDQIERIEGPGTTLRPNELDRIDKMEQELLKLVDQVRTIPPENFLLSDPAKDVNTSPEGT